MANPEHVEILKQGVEAWNRWREENPEIRPDLTGVHLENANFENVNLSVSNLQHAYIANVNLENAPFIIARLEHARFTDVTLKNARFDRARFGDTLFINVNLARAVGLEMTQHNLPSSVDSSTLQLSEGKIPEGFLRGCGLRDWEIESAKLYNPDLSNQEIDEILYRIHDFRANQALQISPVFISYSHADSAFVDNIEKKLNDKGIRFWRDVHHATAGRLEKQIDAAIRHNPTVLVILSENSTKSDWVEHEVRTARLLEKDLGRDVLCPVALDDSWKSARWPARIMEQIMEYNILDFSGWQDDDKFNRQFGKLIDGLDIFYK